MSSNEIDEAAFRKWVIGKQRPATDRVFGRRWGVRIMRFERSYIGSQIKHAGMQMMILIH